MYKPLPEPLTIKQSKVDGLGLFAKEGIAQGTNLGTCHIKIGEHLLRTPLGGFINHANDHNCVKVELRSNNETIYHTAMEDFCNRHGFEWKRPEEK